MEKQQLFLTLLLLQLASLTLFLLVREELFAAAALETEFALSLDFETQGLPHLLLASLGSQAVLALSCLLIQTATEKLARHGLVRLDFLIGLQPEL